MEENINKAKKIIKELDKDIVSVSFIQRHLGVGYNTAVAILEKLIEEKYLYKTNAHDWVVLK